MSKTKLFTEEEAAKQMSISAISLYRRRKEKKAKYYRKIGRLIRYTQEDIDRNIAEFGTMRPTPVSQPQVTEARFG